ncbi:MAG: PH domain-containing protein [Candidatus Paceibacterota bacterium]
MKKLDPKVVWCFFFSFVLRPVIPMILLSILSSYGFILGSLHDGGGVSLSFSSLSSLKWLLIIIIIMISAFLVLCFIWAKLTYHFYRYELTDAGFRKELGVIYKKYVTIPYDRIQNVDIYRGILARIFGLSNLYIQTAGKSGRAGSEGRLPGLSRRDAELVRDELIQRARQTKNQGL